MKIVCTTAILLFGMGLAGCGLEQIAARQRATELTKQYQAAMNDCRKQYPAGEPKTIVAKVQCLNQAYAIQLPTLGRNTDLGQNYMDYRLYIAGQIQSGKMTMAQGKAAIDNRRTYLLTEWSRRDAIALSADAQRRAVEAQQRDAAAAEWEEFGRRLSAANAAYAAGLAQSRPATTTMCFKRGERVSGLNKICYYNCLGSEAATTISSVELCPLNIER